MTAKDWTDVLTGVQGRVTLVNTTEASFPFLETLSSKGRVVITATDSAAQKYATVFPEYFIKAMKEASSDLDKNGRTSIFEVFSAASAAVKQHYEQRGQLTTERSLIDDNGDGVGREAEAPGPDGSLARLVYRFYELISVYGTTFKALIHEEFGDGIMSAIDFKMDLKREADPKGDRVSIVMSGKFLPYKTY